MRLLNSSNLAVIQEKYGYRDNNLLKNKPPMKGSRSCSSISSNIIIQNNKQSLTNKEQRLLLNKNDIFGDGINDNWRQMSIASIISDCQLMSKDPKEIMVKGSLSKLIISHLFTNCSINVEKFCLLTKFEFEIYKSKENCLLIGKPQQCLKLTNVINCKRIDFKCLNILKLQGLYFFYIETKKEITTSSINQSDIESIFNEDKEVIKKIMQRETEETFFVFFSIDEHMINQWVCIINFFLNKIRRK